MKFLEILEKAWLVAAVAAFIMGAYNLVTLQAVTYKVYFPFFCCGFCILLNRNLHGQRMFVKKMKETKRLEEEKAGQSESK